MITKHIILTIFIILSLFSSGQEKAPVFTQEQLLWYIKQYHPISARADLLINKGESTIRKARGLFDPLINSQLDNKNYDEKTYYNLFGTSLKIPTWYGIELNTGFEHNSGAFLNSENSVPTGGLLQAGISLPLGQGLFIDKRRATLKQAELYAKSTQSEQGKILNDLYFNAIEKYWQWVEAWNQWQVYKESLTLAEERFDGVKQSFLFGDIPAIDTLEAFIQTQNRQMNCNEYQLEYQKRTLELSTFLWFENNTPLVISDSMRAPLIEDIAITGTTPLNKIEELLEQLDENHPEMQLYQFKLASMEVDRQLKAEALKPKLNLKYNALNEPVGNDWIANISAQNFKWGFAFGFPLFLRQERGSLQLAQLNIRDMELAQHQKLLEIKNKLKSYYNEQTIMEAQVTLYSKAVKNYDRLLQGEKQKFNTGESSLFLVNSRETNLINARQKFIELIVKYKISQYGLKWAGGILHEL